MSMRISRQHWQGLLERVHHDDRVFFAASADTPERAELGDDSGFCMATRRGHRQMVALAVIDDSLEFVEQPFMQRGGR